MKIQRLIDMHKEKGMSCEDIEWTLDEKMFRYKFILEEAKEFADSHTPEEEVDALIDCIVVCMGTLERMGHGAIAERAFDIVMDANDKKIPGKNEKRGNFPVDLMKPPGWTPPNQYLKALLEAETGSFSEESIRKVLQVRGDRYGKFGNNVAVTQSIYQRFMESSHFMFGHGVREVIHMVAHKTARIICGDHLYPDNVVDIIGYLTLYRENKEYLPIEQVSILANEVDGTKLLIWGALCTHMDTYAPEMSSGQVKLILSLWNRLVVEFYQNMIPTESIEIAERLLKYAKEK